MPQVMVWKHPRTNRLYESKSKYLAVLKKDAIASLDKKHAERRDRELQEAVAARVEFIEDFPTVVAEEVLKYFAKRMGYTKSQPRPKFGISLTVNRNEHVRNSHDCPRNGVTNWSPSQNPPDRPTGYPGWYGRISIVCDHIMAERHNFGDFDINDTLDVVGLYLGSGSGRTTMPEYVYNAEVSIFDDDFPKLAEMHKKMTMVAKLTA